LIVVVVTGKACAGALQAEYIGITWNGAANGEVGVKLSNALARYHHVPMPGVSPPVIVPPNALFQAQRKQIVEAELASRLPVICTDRLWAEVGGLLSYGVNQTDNWRGAAFYLDKILKGASPGDLPIEFATKIELVINLKTAKALGLTIPSTVLSRADDVIE